VTANKKYRGMTKHHVPPRSRGAKFVIRVLGHRHSAYHLLFGNARSLEACIEILEREWWTDGSQSEKKQLK